MELQPNGEVTSTSGLTKRAASCDERLIVMEEVAPMRTPLRSGIRIFLADLLISDRYYARNTSTFKSCICTTQCNAMQYNTCATKTLVSTFSVAGPVCWNSLPDYLKSSDLSFDCFVQQLKT